MNEAVGMDVLDTGTNLQKEFQPFIDAFTQVATKFGAKLAFTMIVSFLIFAYPVMEQATEIVALAKIAGVVVLGVVFLIFRFITSPFTHQIIFARLLIL